MQSRTTRGRILSRRLALLTQQYPPEPAAAGLLAADLARGLVEQGLQVTVYTAQPSYSVRTRRDRSEIEDGVKIRRVVSMRGDRHRAISRLLSAGSFCLSVLGRLLFSRRSSLLVLSNPPMLFWVAWVLNRLRGFPYTLLIHDVYPDVAIRLGVLSEKGIAARLWRALNRCAYEHARAIIVLGERMRETLAEHPGVDREKLVVIHNWADPSWIHPLEKGENPFVHEQGLSEKLVVLYSGNMGRHHDLETLIEAADRCREMPDVLFLFIGDGAKKGALMARARERELGNVRFLPYQPLDRLPYTIPAADIGVVTLERGVESLCVPSKLYTYLAAGAATLGLVGQGSEVADVIEEFDCGFRVDQMDVASVVEAIERWASQPDLLEYHKRNARRALEERFTRSQALKRYTEVLIPLHKDGCR